MHPMYTESEIVASGKAYERKCGVYFLVDGSEIVYVGQSTDILFRISCHINAGKKNFERYAVLYCDHSSLSEVEADYIVRLVPKYNVTLPENKKWATLAALKRITGKDLPAIKRHIKGKGIEDTNGFYLIEDFKEMVAL